nr:MAG TPA: hypothetical protein [Caudoviricetes sp.]
MGLKPLFPIKVAFLQLLQFILLWIYISSDKSLLFSK